MILKGARQVGKTWLMKHFGEENFENVAYVNFDNNNRMKEVFDDDYDIERILMANFRDKLVDWMKKYYYVGGMLFKVVLMQKKMLLNLYKND